MSLILEGIDLPDKGDVIHLEIYSDGSVWDRSNWEPHPPKVSAIQIERPHGRLGDLDKLKKSYYGTKNEIIFAFIMEHEIINAPTILEAEESNEPD